MCVLSRNELHGQYFGRWLVALYYTINYIFEDCKCNYDIWFILQIIRILTFLSQLTLLQLLYFDSKIETHPCYVWMAATTGLQKFWNGAFRSFCSTWNFPLIFTIWTPAPSIAGMLKWMQKGFEYVAMTLALQRTVGWATQTRLLSIKLCNWFSRRSWTHLIA